MELDTAHYRRLNSDKLRLDLQSPVFDEIVIDKFIFIDLPLPDEHKGHIMEEVR